MSSTTIEQLEVEIKSSSTSAVSGIEALTKSLNTLKSATKGGVGLTSISSQLKTIDSTLKSMSGNSNKITTLANSLEKLRNVSNIKISSSLANQLKAINQVASSIKGSSYSGITQLSNALGKLQNIGSLKVPSNLGDKLTSLSQSAATLNGQDYSGIRNLASALSQLNGVDLSKLNSTVSNLSTSLKGLNSNMNQTSSSTEDFGETLSDVEEDTEEATEKNKKLVITWSDIANKIKSAISIIQKVSSVLGSVIGQSNDYIEDMNLAVSSLGSNFADAQAYAEDLTEKLGIDSAEFLKYEGTFDTIIEGFGVASDKAYRMSKQLTELGYDISSYANIDVSEAMTKLQSGISGELEPLRRLGYDLSDARLAQDALTLGITKSTSAMTQAEKSQLRYYEILTQVTVAQGDMARTINAPANQLRVFRAQVTMCVRAIGNLFIPILNKVLPVGIAFVKVLRKMAEALAGFLGIELSTVDDSAWESASNAASSLADTTSDIADTASDVADSSSSLTPSYTSAAQAAKKLKNNLLGIDELNVLSQDDDDSLSDSLSDLGNTGLGDTGLGNTGLSDDAFDIPIPEYDFASSVSDYLSDTINDIEEKIENLMAFAAGALLAIGLILVAVGQVPLGIACIIAGVGIAAAVIGGTDVDRKIKELLLGIMVFVGACLVGLGIMLIIMGQIPIGLGLIVAGAATLASAVAVEEYALGGKISKELQGMLIMTGVVMIGIGILLICFGQIAWGVGFIVAGATAVATAVALNPGQALSSVAEFFSSGKGYLLGEGLIVVGLVLLAFGASMPLGIALIAAGALSIVASAVADPEGAKQKIKDFFSDKDSFVAGAFLVMLGILLLCTVAFTALGIGCIGTGIGVMVAAVAMNKDIQSEIKNYFKTEGLLVGSILVILGIFLLSTVAFTALGIGAIAAGITHIVAEVAMNKDVQAEIKEFFKTDGLLVGTILVLLGMFLLLTVGFSALGIGAIAAGITSIVAEVAMNKDVQTKIKKFFEANELLVGSILVILGMFLILTAAFTALGVGAIAVGIGTIVHAIATNKDVQSKLKKGFKENGFLAGTVLVILGMLLCMTVAFIAVGVGAIAAGITAIVTAAVLNKDGILKKVKSGIKSVKEWVKKHEFVLGVILCATGVGIPIGVRLIKDYYANQKSSDSSKESILEKVKKAFKGIGKEGETAGKNLAKGVKKGYDDNTKAESFGSKLLSGIKSFFGIHSPSTVMRDEVGTYLGSGLLEGINSGTGDISSWLSENVLDPLKEGINNNPLPNIALKIGTKAKDLWSGFKEKWDGVKSSVSAKVSLAKNKWKSVASWAKEHIGGKVSKGIDLAKNKWDSVASWVKEHAGKTVSHGVKLTKSGWSKVSSWIYKYPGSVVKHGVKLAKSGWSRVKSWVDQFQGDSVKKDVSLTKYWYTVSDWVSGFIGGAVSVAVNLTKGWAGSIGSFLGFSGGGIIGANGSIQMFANGGVINWNSIPKYANGTNKPHGSMFVAGESGAELVGHVNGQTEVMNRFQLASVMKESIVSGMTQFANYWQSMSRDMVTCANGVINAVMVSGDEMNNSIAMANESSVYNPYTEGVAYNMQSETGKGSTPDDKWMDNMRTFYTNYVEPTMKAIASDVKTQADKSEKTVVQMNGKTLLSAIEKQKKANGHSFIK